MTEGPHFLTCPRGFEDLLVAELDRLGCAQIKTGHGGARFIGGMEQVRAIALWSRLGGRLLRELAQLQAGTPDELYASAMAFDWVSAFGDAKTFSIHVNLARNARLDHERYALHRLKDAIVDRFAQQGLPRPDVAREDADIVLDLAVHADRATLSVDAIGEPLSRRGLRDTTAPAPLRENLAAALLMRAGWSTAPAREAEPARAFVDPMCGSGTILFEAWMMAADRAPGLLRERCAFEAWADHDPSAWLEARGVAKARAALGAKLLADQDAAFVGSDADPQQVAQVREAAHLLGAEDSVRVSTRELHDVRAPAQEGLLLTNPPWGRRLGSPEEAAGIFAALGANLREHFLGWQAGILAGEAGQGHALGLNAYRRHKVHNGKVDCQLLRVDVTAAVERAKRRQQKVDAAPELQPPADLVNRLQKNLKARRKLAKRLQTDAIRIYDADLPEYAFAVDLYLDHVQVAEYAPPKTIPESVAGQRRRAALAAIRQVLDAPRERVHLKRRARQKGSKQYEAREVDPDESRLVVREGPARFEVQLEGYLDTGLFLDHRPIRAWLREHAQGARFLNLFCYTATASVHAIIGGAASSVSVDMSTTYIDWAARNYELNFAGGDIDPKQHRLVRDDVLAWLEDQPDGAKAESWDLIFCDPPTFSNSKRMDESFDVETGHVALIRNCMRRLAPKGRLVFSTNYRRFKLDEAIREQFDVREFGTRSIPDDFARRSKIHQAFEIRHK